MIIIMTMLCYKNSELIMTAAYDKLIIMSLIIMSLIIIKIRFICFG